MQLIVNGKPVDCPEGIKLTGLIQHLELKPEAVVVEHNRELVHGEQYDTLRLNEGDRLEVLHFVGGG